MKVGRGPVLPGIREPGTRNESPARKKRSGTQILLAGSIRSAARAAAPNAAPRNMITPRREDAKTADDQSLLCDLALCVLSSKGAFPASEPQYVSSARLERKRYIVPARQACAMRRRGDVVNRVAGHPGCWEAMRRRVYERDVGGRGGGSARFSPACAAPACRFESAIPAATSTAVTTIRTTRHRHHRGRRERVIAASAPIARDREGERMPHDQQSRAAVATIRRRPTDRLLSPGGHACWPADALMRYPNPSPLFLRATFVCIHRRRGRTEVGCAPAAVAGRTGERRAAWRRRPRQPRREAPLSSGTAANCGAKQTAEAYRRACNALADSRPRGDLQPDDPAQWIRDRLRGETRDILIAGHFTHLPRLLCCSSSAAKRVSSFR